MSTTILGARAAKFWKSSVGRILAPTLKNNGSLAIARNIKARLVSLDPFVDVNTDTSGYDDIVPGAMIQSNNSYVFDIDEDSPGNVEIPFAIEINSNNYSFWRDTFHVHIYPTGIADEKENIPYKPAFSNHPCTKWVRESKENYIWLCNLAYYLCKQYSLRYGKQHKTQKIIDWCKNNIPLIFAIKQNSS